MPHCHARGCHTLLLPACWHGFVLLLLLLLCTVACPLCDQHPPHL
jgi:hypothetical protein